MPNLRIRTSDGAERQYDVAHGTSIMQVALRDGVPGMVAECGGALTCATCHVYVDEEFVGAVGEVDIDEDELLDGAAAERRPCSRLSCQIEMNDELDGIVVEIAPAQ